MSALPPKADMCGAQAHVCLGQKRTHAAQQRRSLFDHLVGATDQKLWDIQPERLCGFEIDHQLVLVRRLHRHVGWLLALKDAIDIAGGSPIQVSKVSPIGDQAAAGNWFAAPVDRRKLVSSGKRNDQSSLSDSRPTRCRNQSAIWLAR